MGTDYPEDLYDKYVRKIKEISDITVAYLLDKKPNTIINIEEIEKFFINNQITSIAQYLKIKPGHYPNDIRAYLKKRNHNFYNFILNNK